MTIIVNGISPSYGGNGGDKSHNDFNDIITNPSFGGSINIKSIDIRSVEVSAGDVVDYIIFTYNVVTDGGMSQPYTGNTYGRVGGTANHILDNEKVISIRGKYGEYDKNIVVGQIDIQTNVTLHTFGAGMVTEEESFNMPLGVIFGKSGDFLDSIGTIQIGGIPKPPGIATVTTTVRETIFSTSDQNNYPTPTSTLVSLSTTTAILGLYFVITVGIFLWRKFPRVNLKIPADRP